MSTKFKIFLVIIAIIDVILFYSLVVHADEIDDLKNDIKQAETELFIAEKKLKEINPEMFEFYKQNKHYSTSSDIVNFYLEEHRKEYFEYEQAFGNLEDLLEVYNMAIMNSINNEKEVK